VSSTVNPAGWVVSAQATAAAATATQPAPLQPYVSARKNIVFGVDASFSPAPGSPVLLQIKDDSTVIWQGYVPTTGNLVRQFTRGLNITPGNAASAVLASGGASVTGSVNLDGVAI
jgi:hypothetical protein